MKPIRDIRIEGFVERIGFELDQRSGLYLPDALNCVFHPPSIYPASTRANSNTRTGALTFRTLEVMLQAAERHRPPRLPGFDEWMRRYYGGFDVSEPGSERSTFWLGPIMEWRELPPELRYLEADWSAWTGFEGSAEAEPDSDHATYRHEDYVMGFGLRAGAGKPALDEGAEIANAVQEWLDDSEDER